MITKLRGVLLTLEPKEATLSYDGGSSIMCSVSCSIPFPFLSTVSFFFLLLVFGQDLFTYIVISYAIYSVYCIQYIRFQDFRNIQLKYAN